VKSLFNRQAQTLYAKIAISLKKRILETINEWESGDIEATTPTEANHGSQSFPETADRKYPPFYSSEAKPSRKETV